MNKFDYRILKLNVEVYGLLGKTTTQQYYVSDKNMTGDCLLRTFYDRSFKSWLNLKLAGVKKLAGKYDKVIHGRFEFDFEDGMPVIKDIIEVQLDNIKSHGYSSVNVLTNSNSCINAIACQRYENRIYFLNRTHYYSIGVDELSERLKRKYGLVRFELIHHNSTIHLLSQYPLDLKNVIEIDDGDYFRYDILNEDW